MIGQEMQRGVGEDEVRPILGLPMGNVLLHEFGLWRADARMRQHRIGGVEADGSRARKAPKQQFRAVAGAAAEIVDEFGRGQGNRGQKIARRAHPLGLELGVESRVPVAHRRSSGQAR